MRQTKFICLIFWLGQKSWREEKSKEEEEKEEEGGEEEEDQGMFVLESSVFWIPRALVWRFVAPLSRVLEDINQTLEFGGVMRVKP